MRTQLLVTAFGEDRPGIVARLTEVFVKHAANLEESRMAILGGEFAAIVLVDLPKNNIDALDMDLKALKSDAIHVFSKETQRLDPERFKGYAPYEITLRGADHEGIVHQVSSYLHEQKINIQAMDTTVEHAPETGLPLFCMKAIMLVPPSLSYDDLRKNLNKIATAESVDIDIHSKVLISC